MRNISSVAALLTLAVFAACDTASTGPTGLAPVVAAAPGNGNGGGPPGGGGDGDGTVFTATLRDADTDGIVSDGQGTYTDGVDDVTVTINSDGQFFLQTRQSAVRALDIRVEDALGAALFDGLVPANLQTRNISNEGGVDLRALAVGESTAVPVRVGWFDGGVQYRLRFGRECRENVVVAEEMGVVTRTADNTWTVANGPSGRLCMNDTQGTNNPNDDTTSEVIGVTSPFELTVVEQ